MKYFIEEFEGEFTAYCDEYPRGACHTTYVETAVLALETLINVEIPHYVKFLETQEP